ncbi:tetratricopeptide repeat protein [Cognatishimia sp.]|uniref:tetratricopeptide repeat protein n=1 Tax=Cognatishimia sp. TaxID=2211648 RepID=UPI003510FFFE
MSDTDSFIDEVTEEVRRDALFAQFRRYGWIAVVAVVAIVGGASWNELQKSQQRSAAQATGDALLSALDGADAAARATALQTADLQSGEADIVRQLLLSAAQLESGDAAAAAATLNGAATSDVDAIYKDLAAFKAVLAQSSDMSAQDRRIAFETLASAGRPLALYASEQIALLEIEAGNIDVAVTRLQTISLDAGASAGLRQRATQLIVALGGEPEDLPTATEGQ